MTAKSTDSRVDAYLLRHPDWEPQLTALRSLLNATELEETIKWGGPAYILDGKLVVSLAGFKHHCALWFHQGVFLKDDDGVLRNAQKGKTRGMRQWRFEAGDRVKKRLVRRYVLEAIANARAGKQIKPRKAANLADVRHEMPAELAAALAASKALARDFAALTPGRQREYANYIGDAKREATRHSRLAKIKPMIRQRIGLNSKYQRR